MNWGAGEWSDLAWEEVVVTCDGEWRRHWWVSGWVLGVDVECLGGGQHRRRGVEGE